MRIPSQYDGIDRYLARLSSVASALVAFCALSGCELPDVLTIPTAAPAVAAVDVLPSTRTVSAVGETHHFTAVAWSTEGGTFPDEVFAWASSDESVVTINGPGDVRIVGYGTAEVTASTSGLQGATVITVDSVDAEFRVDWTVRMSGWANASITVAEDGTVYLAAVDGHVYAIGPNGDLLWVLATDYRLNSTPAIAEDGTLYMGTDEQLLIAVTPDGQLQGALQTGAGRLTAAPAIGADGTIYVGTEQPAILYAVDPIGTFDWVYNPRDSISWSSPAIAEDGTIYFGSTDSLLYAVNPDGRRRWTFATNGPVRSSPAIASDGTIYFGSDDGNLYAIDPGGMERWRVRTGDGGHLNQSSPAIGADGTIYIGSQNSTLWAVNPDGSEKWVFCCQASSSVSAVVAADGTIYTGGPFGAFYALDERGEVLWRFSAGDQIFSAPAIGPDGSVYVASYDRVLYALSQPNKPRDGLADAPWPMFGGDRRNTGRAGSR